jgi:Skp family chaperone for outer membrane proteins
MSETGSRGGVRWYEVFYVVVLLALLLLSVYFTERSSHRVAVLDVDRVAKDVGLFARMETERATDPTFVKGTRMQQAYVTRMTDLKARLDTARTAEEKKKVQSEIAASDELYRQNALPLRNELQRHEAMVVATFRNRLQSVIQQVARSHRLDLVFYVNPNLAYARSLSGPWGQTTDITEEVAKQAKSVITPALPLIDPALTNHPPAVAEP